MKLGIACWIILIIALLGGVPALRFIGWMLLLCLAIPIGGGQGKDKKDNKR